MTYWTFSYVEFNKDYNNNSLDINQHICRVKLDVSNLIMITFVLCVLSFISGGVTVYLTLRNNPKLKNTVDGITDVIDRNK